MHKEKAWGALKTKARRAFLYENVKHYFAENRALNARFGKESLTSENVMLSAHAVILSVAKNLKTKNTKKEKLGKLKVKEILHCAYATFRMTGGTFGGERAGRSVRI